MGKTVKFTLLLFHSPVVATCLFQTAIFQYNSNGFHLFIVALKVTYKCL